MAAVNTNRAVVVIKGHAGNEDVRSYVVEGLKGQGITIDKELELRAMDVLKNIKITRINRPAFAFLDTVYVFSVSWDATKLSWKDFSTRVIGDIDEDFDEPQHPDKSDSKSLRYQLAAEHADMGIEVDPSEENNMIYASPNPIAAIADRFEWFDQEFDEDPFVDLVARSTENGYEVTRRYTRNIFLEKVHKATTAKGQTSGNVFDLIHHYDTAQAVEFITAEEAFFEDIVDTGRKLGARRSTMRVTQEAPMSETVYQDLEFRKTHKDVVEWVRVGDLYPAPEDGALLPNDASTKQFCQGIDNECTLLGAVALLCERHPRILENLFVSKEARKDGHYTFQFYQWDKWERVEIDDYLPCDEDRTLIHCRSPTKHWWPLLLEKAYAKFYGGYAALQGGILSETIHDLTAKPVESYVLTEEFVKQGAIPDFTQGSFWLQLFKEVEERKLVLSIPASRGDGTDDGPTREDSYAHGYEPGHGYAAMEMRVGSGGSEEIDNLYVRLHNPFSKLGIKEGEIAEELGYNYRVDDERDDFWVSIDDLLQVTQTIYLCRIEGVEDHPYIHEGKWEGITAGGPPSSVSWRHNPIFTVTNSSGKDVKAMVVLKQRDQRKDQEDGDEREWQYIQCGLVGVRNDTEGGQYPTPYITNNLYKPFHRGVFLNQREVCDAVTFGANTLSYIVPSTLDKADECEFLLAVYLPQGTSAKDVEVKKLHADVDHVYPLRREIIMQPKEKSYVDLILHQPTQVHCLLRQRSDKLMTGTGTTDMSTDIHVALTAYDMDNKRIGGMTSGLNYKENAVILHLEEGRYNFAVAYAKGTIQLEADLYVSVDPDSMGVLAPHRDYLVEEEELEEAEEEMKAHQEALEAKKKAAADAERKRKEKEEADKRAAEEAEKQRIAKEAADKAVAEEAGRKKKEKEEADRLAAEEAEKKRLAKEAADKAAAEEAEKQRLAKEAADKKAAEEADKKRLEKEAADNAAKAAAEEAKRKKKEQEAADRSAKEAADAAEAERKRKEKEEADKRAAEEAEKKRLAKEEADEKAAAEEAERKRLEKEAADKAAADDAEKKRLAKEAADKAAADEAERKRLAKEEADKKAAEEAERKKEKEEADRLATEEAEKKRLAKEAADKAAAEEAERKRLEREEKSKLAAEEAERKRKEKEEADRLAKEEADAKAAEEAERKRLEREEKNKLAAEEADRKRKEKEEADKAAAEARAARKAKEAERKRRESEEKEARTKEDREAIKKQREEEKRRREAEEEIIRQKVAAYKQHRNQVHQGPNRPPPKPPSTSPASPRSARPVSDKHYLSPTTASKAKDIKIIRARSVDGGANGGGKRRYTEQSPRLPAISGFGTSSPRMTDNYRILPYIAKYEEGIF